MEQQDIVYGAWRVQLKIDRVIDRRKGDHHDILIFENRLFGRVLALDGIVQTTERDEFVFHEMIAHVPLFALAAPRDVLIIGGGDGGALRRVLQHPSVARVHIAEIDSGVIACSREHLPAICGKAFDDPRCTIIVADGVDYIAGTKRRFDTILIDATDPVGPGAALVHAAFYRNCRDRLTEGGVLVTQHGVPFAEPDWLARPFARIGDAFAHTRCYLASVPANYGGFLAFTMASDSAGAFDVTMPELRRRHANASVTPRYYTPDIHQAAFALPPYITEIIA